MESSFLVLIRLGYRNFTTCSYNGKLAFENNCDLSPLTFPARPLLSSGLLAFYALLESLIFRTLFLMFG